MWSDFSSEKSPWQLGGEGICWGEGGLWENREEAAKEETKTNWRRMRAVERKRRDHFGSFWVAPPVLLLAGPGICSSASSFIK